MTKPRSIVISLAIVPAAMLAGPAAGQTCVLHPDGLIAWWDGDDVSATTAFDIENGHTGTLIGGVTSAPGLVGTAFSFDGTGFIRVGSPASLDLGGLAGMTVDAWIFLTTAAQKNFAVIADKRDNIFATGQAQWALQFGVDGALLKPGFVVANDSGGAGFTPRGPELTINAWHHLAGVYDGTRVRLYVDGVEVTSTALSGPIKTFDISSSPTMSIGGFDRLAAVGGPKSQFTGLIDEVEIYNRALTPTEILAIFNAGSAGKCKDIDSDGDGLFDSTEVETAEGSGCPDPGIADSDGDTLSDGEEVLVLGTDPCNPDSDGDGVDDATDPTPLDPGVPPAFLDGLTRDLCAAIQALDLSLFNGPNNNANKGRRGALANRACNAANKIASGDLAGAIDKLQSLLEKIDGQSPPPDWMGASPEKAVLAVDVELVIALLLVG